MKDNMGMDYVPIYADAPEPSANPEGATGTLDTTPGSGKKILYYVSPMDPTLKSDVPMQDEMGMDYVAVYGDGAGPAQAAGSVATNKGIRLSAEQEQLIGVKTTKVERRTVDRVLQTLGKIAYNEQSRALVSVRFAGRIDRLVVNYTGAQVQAGDPLMYIYSPALVSAQQELLQAKNDQKGGGQFAGMSEALLNSAKSRLKLWGLSTSQIEAIMDSGVPLNSVPVLSPISGTVLKLNVLAGQYVEEGMMAFELSDLRSLWMEAEIYEQDIASVSRLSSATMVPIALPDTSYTGKVSFISPTIDPMTRTTRIRVNVDNSSGLLKPGMFVNVSIASPGSTQILALPQSAVLDTGKRKLVYVKTGPGRYVGRTVSVGPKSGAFYPVLDGVSEGEEVVTEANFLIDSESQLKGAVN